MNDLWLSSNLEDPEAVLRLLHSESFFGCQFILKGELGLGRPLRRLCTIGGITCARLHAGRWVSTTTMLKFPRLLACSRTLLALVNLAALVLLFLLSFLPPVAAQGKPRPNILLIVADDMGWSDAGAYGGEIFTPNIDRLASQGCQFLNFHVGAMCAPTRSVLMLSSTKITPPCFRSSSAHALSTGGIVLRS